VIGLLRSASGTVTGVVCDGPEGREGIEAGAVVLACGGFEANACMRERYLGSDWGAAKVRGAL
jgi:tricarballylate dehydrogenase